MNYKKFNEEVYYSQDDIAKVTSKDICFLKSLATKNPRKRVRLCLHQNVNDSLHEMIIVHAKGIYVPPHKHLSKSESFHIIEGEMLVVIFDEEANIHEVISMGTVSKAQAIFYRLSESHFHTVIPISDWVVFHEITNGPFVREEMLFAPWAPGEEDEVEEQENFLEELFNRLSY